MRSDRQYTAEKVNCQGRSRPINKSQERLPFETFPREDFSPLGRYRSDIAGSILPCRIPTTFASSTSSGWQYGVKLTFAALVSNHKPTDSVICCLCRKQITASGRRSADRSQKGHGICMEILLKHTRNATCKRNTSSANRPWTSWARRENANRRKRINVIVKKCLPSNPPSRCRRIVLYSTFSLETGSR